MIFTCYVFLVFSCIFEVHKLVKYFQPKEFLQKQGTLHILMWARTLKLVCWVRLKVRASRVKQVTNIHTEFSKEIFKKTSKIPFKNLKKGIDEIRSHETGRKLFLSFFRSTSQDLLRAVRCPCPCYELSLVRDVLATTFTTISYYR